MILFEWIEVKNFMNYGNAPTKLTLNTHRNTIITGKNGAGKSSILLDSMCYVFFGKPYRDIKLGQLINSINGKGMVVRGAFTRDGDTYTVTRGQKPSVFLIEKNGIPIEEEAVRGSYQEYLDGILGMNFMTFKQVVVIGSANYIPFMRLSTPQRREVVETMLPIKIFTEAARVVRERIATTKKDISDIDIKVAVVKDGLKKSKEVLDSIQEEKQKQASDIERQRQDVLDKLKTLNDFRSSVTEPSEQLSKTKAKNEALTKASSSASNALVKISTEIQTLIDTKEFYHQEKCPTCEQVIDEKVRLEIDAKSNQKISELESKRNEMNEIVVNLQQKQTELQTVLKELEDSLVKVNETDWKIKTLTEQLSGLVLKDVSDTEIKVKQNVTEALSTMEELVESKSALVARQSIL
jgi:DNA repair exonuclease SbcCD ATPase subunit